MHEPFVAIIAVAVATGAILAELNLIRIFVAGWWQSRREVRSRSMCRRSAVPASPAEPRRSELRREHIATCFIVPALLAPVAYAQESAAQEQYDASAPRSGELASDEYEVTLPKPLLTISTDRPSFSDGTGIQPPWTVNLETGFTYTFRDRDDVESNRVNGPEILTRLGIIEDCFELRFSTSGYTWTQTDDGDDTESFDGLSDISLGFKVKVIDQSGWAPRIAIGVQSSLGAGSDDISTQIAEPAVKFIWSYDLGAAFGDAWQGLTLGGNLNAAWPTSDGDRFTQGQASVYLAFPLGVEGLNGFAEYYIIGPVSKGAENTASTIDTGVTYLLNRRIQLDGRVGFGLNDDADNFFVGVGISFLF